MQEDERERITRAARRAYKSRGLGFTTDDLAEELGISKRTLYKRIRSKNQVIRLIIDDAKKQIKEKQLEIIKDDSLSETEKMKKLLMVQPLSESPLSGRELNNLKRHYPEEYEYVQKLYHQDWNDFFVLMSEALANKSIRPFDPGLFRDIYIGAVTTAGPEKLEEITDLLLNGLKRKGDT